MESRALGKESTEGRVIDHPWFCWQVAGTNKLEFLKWIREEKKCKWDERPINEAAAVGNLEMLKYCFSNDCPCDEEVSCKLAAIGGHLDCLRFLFDKVEPSRDTEAEAAGLAAGLGHTDILTYCVEERKIPGGKDRLRDSRCKGWPTRLHQILSRRGESAPQPLAIRRYARYFEHSDCLNYFLEKGCPEPTDEQCAAIVEIESKQQNRGD